MIKIITKDDLLLVYYDTQGNNWIYSKLSYQESVMIKKTFHIKLEDLYQLNDEDEKFDEDSDFVIFQIGELKDEYYQINKRILAIEFDLFFYVSYKFSQDTFIAGRNTSVFRIFEKIKPITPVYIGGNNADSIPITEFNSMLSQLPNSYELERYSQARVTSILRKYIDTKIDGISLYEKYMNSKESKNDLYKEIGFFDFELIKFRSIMKKMKEMLQNENAYSENNWQNEILKIITILYPKYICAIKEAPAKDYIYNKKRSIDILLVDADGNVDIIEIKKPFEQCIVSSGQYRDNYIPLRDLSGTIMQVEKYIYHLSKWGIEGEAKLTEKFKKELPDGVTLHIINPKGIIIMGRSKNLSIDQKNDFEIIKRKYKSIVDIITYDDLVLRLDTIIKSIEFHITPFSKPTNGTTPVCGLK